MLLSCMLSLVDSTIYFFPVCIYRFKRWLDLYHLKDFNFWSLWSMFYFPQPLIIYPVIGCPHISWGDQKCKQAFSHVMNREEASQALYCVVQEGIMVRIIAVLSHPLKNIICLVCSPHTLFGHLFLGQTWLLSPLIAAWGQAWLPSNIRTHQCQLYLFMCCLLGTWEQPTAVQRREANGHLPWCACFWCKVSLCLAVDSACTDL